MLKSISAERKYGFAISNEALRIILPNFEFRLKPISSKIHFSCSYKEYFYNMYVSILLFTCNTRYFIVGVEKETRSAGRRSTLKASQCPMRIVPLIKYLFRYYSL